MTIHEHGCTCGAFACEMRLAGGLQVMRGKTSDKPYKLPAVMKPPEGPSWEKGIVGEHARDGSMMPYLNADGSPIRVKQWSEERHKLEAIRRRQLAAPHDPGASPNG